MRIQHFFDKDTATFTYVISDNVTRKCAVIDSVLGYDMSSGRVATNSADIVVEYIKENGLSLEWLLETHVHADHLTAAHYIKQKLGGKIAIGEHIKEVLKFWVPFFNIGDDTPLDGSQFDHLFIDGEVFNIGEIEVRVMHTPGHTPACVCYIIGDVVFVGDTIFTPYVGTARTDFPGGSAQTLYRSIQKLLAMPEQTKIFVGHDYPLEGNTEKPCFTVAEEKTGNIMLRDNVSESEYVAARNAKDKGKAVPRLLLPSIQVNLRAGDFGAAENNGTHYIKIPLNKI